MIKVRRNTFETNSSSTHSITMTTGDLYNQWLEGKLYLYNDNLMPLSEIIDNIKTSKSNWYIDKCEKLENAIKENDEEFLAEVLSDLCIYSYDAYQEMVDNNYEGFMDSFITKSGEDVIAFGYYGNDY